MPLHAYFSEPQPVADWIAQGAPLPGIARFTHFGDHEWPKRMAANDISNRTAFDAYRKHGSGGLYSPGFRLDFHLTWQPAEVTFWEYWNPRAKPHTLQLGVVNQAAPLFYALDTLRPMFGYAALSAEWQERHLYKYTPYWSERPSTAPVGQNPARYVPGLYWMTYFSKDYAATWDVDLDALAQRLDGDLRRLAYGTVLRLFERPEAWLEYHGRISQALASMPQFFSLDRVEVLPPELTLREITGELCRVTKPWPVAATRAGTASAISSGSVRYRCDRGATGGLVRACCSPSIDCPAHSAALSAHNAVMSPRNAEHQA
jgi:hypothetical protein